MKTVFDKLKAIAYSDKSDEIMRELLKIGKVEHLTEKDGDMISYVYIFTRNSDGNIYTFCTYTTAKDKNNDIGLVLLKNGTEFYAKNNKDAIYQLNIIKKEYEKLTPNLILNEDYSKLQKVKDAVEEVEEQIKFYEHKQRQDSKGGSISMGEV